jgi:hypothetical protein
LIFFKNYVIIYIENKKKKGESIMSTILENLIKELNEETIVPAKKIKEMFEKEFAATGSEESAAHNVRVRIKYLVLD